ncbi:MAG: helix-turn-helix domain-containing protein [Caldilineaceae bacterium]|nr:helix-turn-helix domain-containing protein [Caldilineaceae bacterium]MDE0534313.1 helix-turn-helix domain-containing protein [Albidovulum sp.]
MKKRFVLQGITQDNHLDEIRDVISIENVSRIIISVAFLNQRGFSLLRDILEPVAGKTVIPAGIRNGITSAQGLLACVECGCRTYTVDTGSRRVVFHPKIYMSKNGEEARLILGSANLTVGGFISNIEASLKVVADLSMADDSALVADLEAKSVYGQGRQRQEPSHISGSRQQTRQPKTRCRRSRSVAISQRLEFARLADRLEPGGVLVVIKLDRPRAKHHGCRRHGGRPRCATAKGRHPGRPHRLSGEERQSVLELLATGSSIPSLVRKFNTSRQTIMRVRDGDSSSRSQFQ